MYTEKMFTQRICIIALSQIQQIREHAHANPLLYRKDTEEYCGAIDWIIRTAPHERLRGIVEEIRKGYEKIGFVDDGVIADSLLTMALADYQDEIGEANVYRTGCSKFLEKFFLLEDEEDTFVCANK